MLPPSGPVDKYVSKQAKLLSVKVGSAEPTTESTCKSFEKNTKQTLIALHAAE